MSWRQNLSLIATIIGAVAMTIAAYATLRTWFGHQQRWAAEKPTLSWRGVRRSKRPDVPHQQPFKLDDQFTSAWQVNSVTAFPLWRPLISRTGEAIQADAGSVEGYQPTGWRRSIVFDPPVPSSTALVRPDCPDRIVLLFKLSLRASPRRKSRFPMRIKIRD